MWMGKHGFVRKPGHYGLSLEDYQRHESARRDKSWSAQGIDAEAVIAEVCQFDGTYKLLKASIDLSALASG